MSRNSNLPIKSIIRDYKNGMNTIQIAKKYNCSNSIISYHLKKNNIQMRSRAESNRLKLNLPEEEIINLYINKNYGAPEIGNMYNCSSTTIYKILKYNNIKLRSTSEALHLKLNLPEEEIINLYTNENTSQNDIANIYNCSRVTIRNLLLYNNIKLRTQSEINIIKNKLKFFENEIIDLYINKYMSSRKIANIYESSPHVIINILGDNNIKIRSILEPHERICIKCNHKFIGNLNSRYCSECKPPEYCDKWDEDCKEQNREKYDRECFFCGITEEELSKKLDSHHVDNNKNQGCDKIPWKLVPLCGSCHGMTKGGEENRLIWEARILYLHKEYWSE